MKPMGGLRREYNSPSIFFIWLAYLMTPSQDSIDTAHDSASFASAMLQTRHCIFVSSPNVRVMLPHFHRWLMGSGASLAYRTMQRLRDSLPLRPHPPQSLRHIRSGDRKSVV